MQIGRGGKPRCDFTASIPIPSAFGFAVNVTVGPIEVPATIHTAANIPEAADYGQHHRHLPHSHQHRHPDDPCRPVFRRRRARRCPSRQCTLIRSRRCTLIGSRSRPVSRAAKLTTATPAAACAATPAVTAFAHVVWPLAPWLSKRK